jgi:hypothetical protein
MVEPVLDLGQALDPVSVQISRLREVLAQQSVRVLVGAVLPWAGRMSEEDPLLFFDWLRLVKLAHGKTADDARPGTGPDVPGCGSSEVQRSTPFRGSPLVDHIVADGLPVNRQADRRASHLRHVRCILHTLPRGAPPAVAELAPGSPRSAVGLVLRPHRSVRRTLRRPPGNRGLRARLVLPPGKCSGTRPGPKTLVRAGVRAPRAGTRKSAVARRRISFSCSSCLVRRRSSRLSASMSVPSGGRCRGCLIVAMPSSWSAIHNQRDRQAPRPRSSARPARSTGRTDRRPEPAAEPATSMPPG